MSVEDHGHTCYTDTEGDLAGRPQKSATAENDSGVESAQVHALRDFIDSLNIVCGFVECNGYDPEMLRLVFIPGNMTTRSATYRTRQSRIEDYSSDCVSNKMFKVYVTKCSALDFCHFRYFSGNPCTRLVRTFFVVLQASN